MKIWRSESENEEVLMKWLGSPFVSKAFQRNCIRSTHFRKLRCGSNSRGHRTDMCRLSSAPLPKRASENQGRRRTNDCRMNGNSPINFDFLKATDETTTSSVRRSICLKPEPRRRTFSISVQAPSDGGDRLKRRRWEESETDWKETVICFEDGFVTRRT